MPPSRKKSCVACRVAKAKCSQINPCTRCVLKQIDCDYGLHSAARFSRHRKVPSLLPITAARGNLIVEDTSDTTPVSSNIVDSLGFDLSGVPKHDANTSGLGSNTFDENTHWSLPSNPDFTTFSTSVSSFQPPLFDLTEPDQFLSEMTSPRDAQVQTSGNSCHSATIIRKGLPIESDLSYRVIIGQLQSYPQMMLTSQLPPFIYPECERGNDSCFNLKGHQCLPTALSNCRTIVAMLDTLTLSNYDFIRRTVCMEADRLRQDSKHWDCFETLQGLQASLIYLLLCTKYFGRADDTTMAYVVPATRYLGQRLDVLYDCRIGFQSLTAVSRKDWIFRESTRRLQDPVKPTLRVATAANLYVGMHRTICVLYGMELLLDVFSREGNRHTCLGYIYIPLPCTRELWEQVSDSEWARRYHQSMSEREKHIQEPLCIGNIQTVLLQSASISSDEGLSQLSIERRGVTDWCERVDELGTLIWMAIMLEAKRQ